MVALSDSRTPAAGDRAEEHQGCPPVAPSARPHAPRRGFGGLRAGGLALVPPILAATWVSVGVAGTLTGQVTGDVTHLPWRKGKATLGWASVRVWQDGRLLRVGRTEMDGRFAMELAGGAYDVEIERPAFLPQRRSLTMPPDGETRWDVALAPDPDFGLVASPRAGMSEFCLPGETIPIACAGGEDLRDWRAVLRTDYVAAPLGIEKAERGEGPQWRGARARWDLVARVPPEVAPGLYRLELSCRGADGVAHRCEQPAAVCVLESYPDRFRVLMHSDWHFSFHVGAPGAEGERQADYFRAAGLLGALWVSLGDDIGFEGDDHVAMFWHLLRHYARTPVFLAFGNHDAAIGDEAHELYFGPRVQSRRVGPAVGIVRCFDLYQADWFMPDDQAEQARRALADFADRPETKVVYLAGHQQRWQPPGNHYELPEELGRFLRPRHLKEASSQAFDRLLLDPFTVMTMHGWGGLHYTSRVADVDLAAGRLTVSGQVILPSVSCEPPNDGRASTVTAVVRARGATSPADKYEGVSEYFTQPPTQEQMVAYGDVTGLRLEFVMPPGRYVARAGRIVRQVDAGQVTLVEVVVDAAGEETRVTVEPAAE